MNGKPSSPVLRGLGASNGARLLDPYRITEGLPVIRSRSVGGRYRTTSGVGRDIHRAENVLDLGSPSHTYPQ
jgi:hypothetical protein